MQKRDPQLRTHFFWMEQYFLYFNNQSNKILLKFKDDMPPEYYSALKQWNKTAEILGSALKQWNKTGYLEVMIPDSKLLLDWVRAGEEIKNVEKSLNYRLPDLPF